MISIKKIDTTHYQVNISKDGETQHNVTLDTETYQQITGEKITPEELIKQSFIFLLERESNQSILRQFNLKVIKQYFPEYSVEIKKFLN
jgi:hypothetical protein